jgi:uncharacterized membrane protein
MVLKVFELLIIFFVFPKIQKILLKGSQSSTTANDTLQFNNNLQINKLGCPQNQSIIKSINIPSIIILSLLGISIIGFFIYLIFIKQIYKANFKFIFKYYALSFIIFSVFIMLSINTTIMGNLNGLDTGFILNTISLCFLVLPLIITFIYNKYSNSDYNLISIISS